MSAEVEKLFVYGTLKDLGVQKEAFGRVAGGTADVLKGYRKAEATIDGESYPIIVPDKNGVVEGLLIEVGPDELKLLDEYEEKYERAEVTLESGVRAWVFVLK